MTARKHDGRSRCVFGLLAVLGGLQGCTLPFHTMSVQLYDGKEPDFATARITSDNACYRPRLLRVDDYRLDYQPTGFPPVGVIVSVMPGAHVLDVAWMDCDPQNQPMQRSAPCTMKLLAEAGRDYQLGWEAPPWSGGDFEVWVADAAASSGAPRFATCKGFTSW